ncbi:hypothetical protein BDR07DRAFT_1462197 [Suillus spraguei]|nr:hypothetical protein BDR07DRAFT_1462197 [Suillus spraguei]
MSQQNSSIQLWDVSTTITHVTCYIATELNDLSIRHPYIAAGALLCICGTPELFLTPLRYTCFLPFQLIIWPFKLLAMFILYILGFRKEGVKKGSYASQYQSRRYGGNTPGKSAFSTFQARAAIDEDGNPKVSMFAAPVTFMACIGIMFVLGRAWGWWY